MMAQPSRSLRENITAIVAVYGAWLVTIALGAGIFYVWTGALRELYIGLRLSPWGFAAFSNAVVLLLGLAWVALVIAAEGWYRTGSAKGRLTGRVARLVTAEVVVLLLGAALLRFA
jgi:hypothetical protein